jgi:hypothetical protein
MVSIDEEKWQPYNTVFAEGARNNGFWLELTVKKQGVNIWCGHSTKEIWKKEKKRNAYFWIIAIE